MAIYKLNADSLQPLSETTFENEGVLERGDLQRILRLQPEIVSPDTLIIAEEFGEWEDSRKRIDLLGVDRQARLVVIELKRNETGSHMDLQAIRYASMVSTLSFKRAAEMYEQFLKKAGQYKDGKEELRKFLIGDDFNESEFPKDVRIVLAAAEFSKELTTSVLWLNEADLDVRCVRLKPYRSDGQTLIDVQQIIPLPEAEELQIRVREQKIEQRREARDDERDFTKYSFENQTYNKRKLVLAVAKAIIKKTPELTFDSLEQLFPDEIRVFRPLQEAKEAYERTGRRRAFLDPNDVLTTSDGHKVAVSNQWSKWKIDIFCDAAKKLGFSISEIL